MAKLVVFNSITLDGFFTDQNGDMSWAHKAREDAEWNQFVAGNASGGGRLLFGRITYQLMASYWPTPQAQVNAPIVAEQMNALPKVVFSRTLEEASWQNTVLVRGDPAAEVRKMKAESDKDMVILGSGSIVSQLAQVGLIDEFQMVLNPIALGRGRTMFETVDHRLDMRLTRTRAFGNGNVFLCYEPVG